jgi:HAD superfamily hydrolase (TIGR01509 family)
VIKAIIFDLDGLMVDTERLYVEVDHILAAEYDRTVDHEVIAQMMGQKPLDAMEIFRKSLNLQVSPLELLQARDKLISQKLRTDLLAMPGLLETVNALYDRYKLAIATAAPQRFASVILDNLDLWNYFEVIQTSDGVRYGKPDSEIYLKTIKRLNVAPNECIVLEDSSNGALAAKRAGCYTIAIPSTYSTHQDFSFIDHLAEDLIAAKEYILSYSD